MLLPAFVALFGVVAALFLLGSLDSPAAQARVPQAADPDPTFGPDDDLYWTDGEDEYVEYEVSWDDSDAAPEPPRPVATGPQARNASADTDVLDPVTEPLRDGAQQSAPVHQPESGWRSILDQLLDEQVAPPPPKGFAHNGFTGPTGDVSSGARGRHSRD